MSREIKFRGKRIDNGEWAYGDLVRYYENQRRFIAYDQLAYMYKECGIDRLVSERFFEVNPDTVGQYTGLLDKNGKEIYEGDIVTGLDSIASIIKAWGGDIKVGEARYVVTWHEGKYHLNKLDGTVGWIINWHISSKVKDLWVIGNIYDNPELLSPPTPREQIPDGGMAE